jgi:hypothetical protein
MPAALLVHLGQWGILGREVHRGHQSIVEDRKRSHPYIRAVPESLNDLFSRLRHENSHLERISLDYPLLGPEIDAPKDYRKPRRAIRKTNGRD